MKKLTTIIGPYPPPYRGVEHAVKAEFESYKPGEALLIGTSTIPGKHEHRILIPRRPFIFTGPALFWKIFRNRKRIESINAHYATTFGFVAFLAKKFFRIPYSVTCHGTDILQNINKFPYRWFTKKALNNSNKIFVVSEGIADVLISNNYPRIKIEVRKNIVKGSMFTKKKARKKNQIIFVGSIQKSKGVDTLLDAFFRVSDKFQNYRLLLVGKIPDRNYYRKLRDFANENGLGSRVEFTGEKRHKELPGLLNESKLFVLPSRSEGYGVALAEALACGLPAVATNVGGIPEVVKDWKGKQACILVNPDSPAEMARAMEKLLKK